MMGEVWSECELIFSSSQYTLTVKMSKLWLFELCLHFWQLWTAASSVNEKLCIKLWVALFLINNFELLWFWDWEVRMSECYLWRCVNINKTFNKCKDRDIQLQKQSNKRRTGELNLIKFQMFSSVLDLILKSSLLLAICPGPLIRYLFKV